MSGPIILLLGGVILGIVLGWFLFLGVLAYRVVKWLG